MKNSKQSKKIPTELEEEEFQVLLLKLFKIFLFYAAIFATGWAGFYFFINN